HAIVHVPAQAGAPELWIDPSVPQLGARETPLEELGHHALLVRPKGGALVRIPMPAPTANTLVTTNELALVPGAPVPLSLRVEGRGAVLMPFRPPWGKDATAHFRDQFEREGGATYTEIVHTGVARTDEPFDLRAKGNNGDRPFYEEWSQTLGLRQTLFLPSEILRGEIDEERTAPYLVLPNRMEEVYRLRVPEGYVLADAPEPFTFESGGVSIALTRAREGDVEVLRVVTAVTKSPLAVEDARALADAFAVLNAGFDGKVRIVAESLKLVEDDAPAEAVARARALVAAHPADAAYRVHLSTVYYRGGFRDLALTELERAAALDPDEPWLLARIAALRFTDPVARPGSPPFDAAAARNAAKACLDMNADIDPCRQTYGMSFAIDASGRFLGDGAPYAGVEAWAAALPEEDRSATLEEIRIRGLLADGKWAEAKRLATKVEQPRWNVVAAALGESATAAAAQITRASEWSRWDLARNAAGELERLRRYPEAHAVAKAGLGRTKEGVKDDKTALVERLATSRRWEERAAELGPAADVALRFLRGVGSGADTKTLTPLASPELVAWVDPDRERDDWWSTLRPIVVSWIGGSWPDAGAIDRGLDEILAVGTFTVEGDEKTGWKVTLRGKDWRRPLRVLLAKGRKGPEVRALTLLDHTVAAEATRRVAAGDVAGAAWWLDAWQQDEPAGDDAAAAARYRALGDADPARVKVAAALLAWPTDPAANAVLAAAFAKETGEKRLLVGRRLAAGLVASGKWADLGPVLDVLAADDPHDRALVRARVELEASRGGWDAAAKLVDAAIAAHPRDVWLRTTAVEVALARGNTADAVAALLAMLETGDVTSRELNEAAWALLFVPGQSAKALALVERAVAMKGVGDGTRHTLAMAQLQNGKVADAVRTLQDEVRRSGAVGNLPDYWWLVRGGIAEAYGLRDEAVAAYRRVPVEPGLARFRTVRYAEARIAALAGAEVVGAGAGRAEEAGR
ncbi:MAG: hypothetical protein ACK4YP_01030, partial [Myxococcota bacterium]